MKKNTQLPSKVRTVLVEFSLDEIFTKGIGTSNLIINSICIYESKEKVDIFVILTYS